MFRLRASQRRLRLVAEGVRGQRGHQGGSFGRAPWVLRFVYQAIDLSVGRFWVRRLGFRVSVWHEEAHDLDDRVWVWVLSLGFVSVTVTAFGARRHPATLNKTKTESSYRAI